MPMTEIVVDRPCDEVWDCFVRPENWASWWAPLRDVRPGWQSGGTLVWANGDTTTLEEVTPRRRVALSARFIRSTYTFTPVNQLRTRVRYTFEPAGGATFTDGGASANAQHAASLARLKRLVEQQPPASPASRTDTATKMRSEGEPSTGRLWGKKRQARQRVDDLAVDGNVEGLIGLVQDTGETQAVRCAAAVTLGELGDLRAVMPLIAATKDESVPNYWEREAVCCTATEALGRLGDPRATERLRAILAAEVERELSGRTPSHLGACAARALGQVNDAQAAPFLIDILHDHRLSDNLRVAAAHSLGNLGGQLAVMGLRTARFLEWTEVQDHSLLGLGHETRKQQFESAVSMALEAAGQEILTRRDECSSPEGRVRGDTEFGALMVPVQDVLTVAGRVVAFGRIEQGSVSLGDDIDLIDEWGQRTRAIVNGIESADRKVRRAGTSDSVALTLRGIDRTIEPERMGPGSVLVHPDGNSPTKSDAAAPLATEDGQARSPTTVPAPRAELLCYRCSESPADPAKSKNVALHKGVSARTVAIPICTRCDKAEKRENVENLLSGAVALASGLGAWLLWGSVWLSLGVAVAAWLLTILVTAVIDPPPTPTPDVDPRLAVKELMDEGWEIGPASTSRPTETCTACGKARQAVLTSGVCPRCRAAVGCPD